MMDPSSSRSSSPGTQHPHTAVRRRSTRLNHSKRMMTDGIVGGNNSNSSSNTSLATTDGVTVSSSSSSSSSAANVVTPAKTSTVQQKRKKTFRRQEGLGGTAEEEEEDTTLSMGTIGATARTTTAPSRPTQQQRRRSPRGKQQRQQQQQQQQEESKEKTTYNCGSEAKATTTAGAAADTVVVVPVTPPPKQSKLKSGLSLSSSSVSSSSPDDEGDSTNDVVIRPKRKKIKTTKVASTTTQSKAATTTKARSRTTKQSTKNKENNKSSSSSSSTKFVPPHDWEETYRLVEELRQDRTAPCDSDGAEALPQHELKVTDPKTYRFQVLIALLLSSQTKDAMVGQAMRNLQKHGLTVDNIRSHTTSQTLNNLIRGVGFHNNKTKYIMDVVQILHDRYDNDIPSTAQEMIDTLPGIGPKMAYLVENICYPHRPPSGIGVDTHMHRLFPLLKFVPTTVKNPEQTRYYLESWLPRQPTDYWKDVNILWVGFGQEVQQQRSKVLYKAMHCSRPRDALILLRRVGVNIYKDGTNLMGWTKEEIDDILSSPSSMPCTSSGGPDE